MPERNPAPLEPDPRVQRALRAAREALAHENWDGAVLAGGTVVREVARSHLVYNDQQGTLPQLIERLVKQQAAEPALAELAAALRPNGPLGGFFDLEEEIDGPVAEATLALVDDLITHVYGFRARIRRLVELVEAAEEGEAAQIVPQAEAGVRADAPAAPAADVDARDAASEAATEPTPGADRGGDRSEDRSGTRSEARNDESAERDAFGAFERDPLDKPWGDR